MKLTSDLPLDTQFATLLGSRFRASLCNKEKNTLVRDGKEIRQKCMGERALAKLKSAPHIFSLCNETSRITFSQVEKEVNRVL